MMMVTCLMLRIYEWAGEYQLVMAGQLGAVDNVWRICVWEN